MKKILFVVFGLLLSTASIADVMDSKLAQIESEWTKVDDSLSKNIKKQRYQSLLRRASHLASDYPRKAEPKIVQACILLTIAEIDGAMSALSLVHQARDLLKEAISINPDARKGTAVFTLGILYYKVPGWPIGFGDDDKAEEMLLSSVMKNPESIGSNYYYGEFLLEQDRPEEAERYLKRAAQTYLTPENRFEYKIKKKASAALAGLI